MGIRLLRINESIKETLSSVITAEGLKDPRVGFVTVTGVETSPDLRHAKVYVSVLGDKVQRLGTMQALEHSRGYLQTRINTGLHMKRTPQLDFFYDDTLDKALHIEKLMQREEAVLGSEAPEIVVDGEDEAGRNDEAEDGLAVDSSGGRPPESGDSGTDSSDGVS
jgi:ribosome-binding factor A